MMTAEKTCSRSARGRELFDGLWVFVSFRVVLPGPLAEVTRLSAIRGCRGGGGVGGSDVGGRV